LIAPASSRSGIGLHRRLCRQDRFVGPRAHVDQVDACPLERGSQRTSLLAGQPSVDEFVGAQPVQQWDLVADRATDRVHDLEREPDAVLERATVVVGPEIGVWGREGVQQVAAGPVYLDCVHARPPHAQRRRGEPVDDLVDLARGQLPRNESAA
jgi:hypothetical protein